jgi:hypothetical protein
MAAMLAALVLVSGEATAQKGAVNDCKSGPGCVEVTVQYSDDGAIRIVDSKTRAVIPSCRICDPKLHKDCKAEAVCTAATGTMDHMGSLQLFKTHKSPGCTLFCSSSGWCKQICK